jgi:hypothetical protein
VEGLYKSDDIKLEENIGTCKVFPAGSINVSFAGERKESRLNAAVGKSISIPVTLQNNSDFTEYINIILEGDIGTLIQNKIALRPGEILNDPVKLLISKNIKNNMVYDIKIHFQPENELTAVTNEYISAEVEVNSGYGYLIRDIKVIMSIIKLPLILVLILSLLFIILGKLFYYAFFHDWKSIKGSLSCRIKNGNEQDKAGHLLKLPELNCERMVISFNETNQNADYYIKGTRYDYDLIITTDYSYSKFAFLEGWKALLKKASPVNYSAHTTIPGIIEKDGAVFTKMIIRENEEFETGGYVFRYNAPIRKSKK